MRKILSRWTTALSFALAAPLAALAQHAQEAEEAAQHASHGDHGAALGALFFIIIALLIGTATRHLLKKSPIPFTVLLFLFGLVLGVLGRVGLLEAFHLGSFTMDIGILDQSVHWAANIDPHMLLYVFLPILIFEAAFAMDVHTFKKTVVNATLLAVPGIVIALLLTGALAIGLQAFGLGFSGWTWPIALMFGAVVSATDPVAVVAILKELGASKKLGTLIEGESLLNDGTAIVFFMVFFLGLTGAGGDTNPILGFLYVSLGGVLVGVLIGWLVSRWVKRVFNDALVEISIIIAAAYLTFYVAENFLHVSGVLGLVSLGLVMAGPGRTSLSPEVEHFLHEFWELAVFLANILIFLIVGVVIAYRTVFTAEDFLLLALIFVGVFVVRAVVIVVLYPLMKRFGYGINRPFAIAAWWGALRGAIGLALALIVANAPEIDEHIRNQFLFLVAGIVLATLLINATTMAALVRKLGLTNIPPAKAAMIASTYQFLQKGTESALVDIKNDRFLRHANWKVVQKYMPKYDKEVEAESTETTVAEIRRRVLEKEKNSYWRQFKDGMLGGAAVRNLSDQIDDMLDRGGELSLSDRPDLELAWQTPALLTRLQRVPLLRKLSQNAFFDRLAVAYESARGFVAAQDEALKLLGGIHRTRAGGMTEAEEAELEAIETEINENRIHGLTFLRNMRKTYPDIYNAIATRQAVRSVLNYERGTVERLLKKGRVEKDEASRLLSDIEHRMKRLHDKPPMPDLNDAVSLAESVPWVMELPAKTRKALEKMATEEVFAIGDTLSEAGEYDSGLLLPVRGTAKVEVEGKDACMLQPGDPAGELSSITGHANTATVVAESPITALRISKAQLRKLAASSPELATKLQQLAAHRIGHNLLVRVSPFDTLDPDKLRKALEPTTLAALADGTYTVPESQQWVLVQGKATTSSETIEAPAVLPQQVELTLADAQLLKVEEP